MFDIKYLLNNVFNGINKKIPLFKKIMILLANSHFDKLGYRRIDRYFFFISSQL